MQIQLLISLIHFAYSAFSLRLTVCLGVLPFRAMLPGGWTADSPAAGGRGSPAMPPSQTPTERPCGPAPRRSGADRNPWRPGRTD